VSTGGYQKPASGNGAPSSLHDVDATFSLWRQCRSQIEQDYPLLVEARLFDNIEELMCVVDLEEQARFLSGDTWMMETPDDYFPIVTIYFEHVDGKIILRAAFAID
jgi:hypothetical protein